MYLSILVVGFVVAAVSPPLGCLILAVDAYLVASAYPIVVGILCGIAYIASCYTMIYGNS